jgi:predicted outer membrane protein
MGRSNRIFLRIALLTTGLLLLTAGSAAWAQMPQMPQGGQNGNMNQGAQPGGTQPNGMQPMPGTENAQQMEERNVYNNLRRNIYVETQLSKLAQKKSGNADVKKFAGQVISENRQIEGQAVLPASNQGDEMAFMPEVPSQTQKAEKQMKKLTGTQFDQIYMAQMDAYLKDDQQVGNRAVGMTDSSDLNKVGMRERTLADQRQKQLTQLAAEENFKIE